MNRFLLVLALLISTNAVRAATNVTNTAGNNIQKTKTSPPPTRPLPVLKTHLRRLVVKAYIDGKSVLKVQGGKLWWEHKEDSLPGKWDKHNEPTVVNDNEWFPDWDGPQSAPLENAVPFISNIMQEIRVHKIKSRGKVTILQQPTAANKNILAVLFDDSKAGGADWYEIELYW